MKNVKILPINVYRATTLKSKLTTTVHHEMEPATGITSNQRNIGMSTAMTAIQTITITNWAPRALKKQFPGRLRLRYLDKNRIHNCARILLRSCQEKILARSWQESCQDLAKINSCQESCQGLGENLNQAFLAI